MPLVAFLLARDPNNRASVIWRTLAFLARYGHQNIDTLMDWPITDLTKLAHHISILIQEESEAARRSIHKGWDA